MNVGMNLIFYMYLGIHKCIYMIQFVHICVVRYIWACQNDSQYQTVSPTPSALPSKPLPQVFRKNYFVRIQDTNILI